MLGEATSHLVQNSPACFLPLRRRTFAMCRPLRNSPEMAAKLAPVRPVCASARVQSARTYGSARMRSSASQQLSTAARLPRPCWRDLQRRIVAHSSANEAFGSDPGETGASAASAGVGDQQSVPGADPQSTGGDQPSQPEASSPSKPSDSPSYTNLIKVFHLVRPPLPAHDRHRHHLPFIVPCPFFFQCASGICQQSTLPLSLGRYLCITGVVLHGFGGGCHFSVRPPVFHGRHPVPEGLHQGAAASVEDGGTTPGALPVSGA